MVNDTRFFTKQQIQAFNDFAGKSLNEKDANGDKYVPEQNKVAQDFIKEAHALIRDWAADVKQKLDSGSKELVAKKISATDMIGRFRSYLPQTFNLGVDGSPLLLYWFFLDSRGKNEPQFKITLGLDDTHAPKPLKDKFKKIKQSHGGEDSFTRSIDSSEALNNDMDFLSEWAIDTINNLPLSYSELLEDLEPEILESESSKQDEAQYWIEKTNVKGRPDRVSGPNALGKALWSPQSSTNGTKIYEEMLKVKAGDLVFHLGDESITGISIASGSADDKFICLEGTDWAGREGYRVDLNDYEELNPKLDRQHIFQDKEVMIGIRENYKKLFYTIDLNYKQGGYLTKLPKKLALHFNKIYKQLSKENLPHFNGDEDVPYQKEDEEMSEENYSINQILKEGCFVSEDKLKKIIDTLKLKKNLILQGPPGTGKTWLAKKLGYALVGSEDKTKVRSFQFHPSLSYEDFIRGYRPSENEKLSLIDGPFMDAIEQAKKIDDPYVVVIEEINRGNPAQIFGEMLTLLEADKRGPSEAMELTYKKSSEELIYIPENLYVIGTMNLADRSLALVDLALRRRFAFFDLEPSLNLAWENWLKTKGISTQFINEIKTRMTLLNNQIADDSALGSQYKIGHSYVTPITNVKDEKEWFLQVIESEIGPLLDEYWFDNASLADEVKNKVREGI
jgi:hypothetical protein